MCVSKRTEKEKRRKKKVQWGQMEQSVFKKFMAATNKKECKYVLHTRERYIFISGYVTTYIDHSLTNLWVLPLIDHHHHIFTTALNDANLFCSMKAKIFKFCGSKFYFFFCFAYFIIICSLRSDWLFFFDLWCRWSVCQRDHHMIRHTLFSFLLPRHTFTKNLVIFFRVVSKKKTVIEKLWIRSNSWLKKKEIRKFWNLSILSNYNGAEEKWTTKRKKEKKIERNTFTTLIYWIYYLFYMSKRNSVLSTITKESFSLTIFHKDTLISPWS